MRICCRKKYERRKSMQSSSGQLETIGMLGFDGADESLWFPVCFKLKLPKRKNTCLPVV